MTKENKIIKKTVFLYSEDKQQQFQKELKELLVKYDASLEVEQYGIDGACDVKIIVSFEFDKNLYDETGNGAIPQWIVGYWEDGK